MGTFSFVPLQIRPISPFLHNQSKIKLNLIRKDWIPTSSGILCHKVTKDRDTK